MISIRINLDKIPADRLFQGKTGRSADIYVAAKRNGADQYGNTHNVYLKPNAEEKESRRYTYIGDGREYTDGPRQEAPAYTTAQPEPQGATRSKVDISDIAKPRDIRTQADAVTIDKLPF